MATLFSTRNETRVSLGSPDATSAGAGASAPRPSPSTVLALACGAGATAAGGAQKASSIAAMVNVPSSGVSEMEGRVLAVVAPESSDTESLRSITSGGSGSSGGGGGGRRRGLEFGSNGVGAKVRAL